MALRCDSSVYRRGGLGSQDDGSLLRMGSETGVALSISDCSAAFLDSRTITCGKVVCQMCRAERLSVGEIVCASFFCNCTTLVYFFL